MAGFFSFGPFSSPVGQLIEKSTDNSASAGNLSLHLQICDTINSSDSGPKDALAALRKRFTGNTKNFHIINLTLTVLETCVKNCGMRFHVKIAQKDFLTDMLKVINPKNNPPTIVKERVLGLIQYWSDAFKGKPQLDAVTEMYNLMRTSGSEFPPINLDALAPIETPSCRKASQQLEHNQLQLSQPASELVQQHRHSSGSQRHRALTGPLKPEQVAKLLTELEVVRKNIDLMNEIMSEKEPGKEDADDMQLLDEINRVVHEMQLRVATLIERCQDEIILETTLTMNDDLNMLFVRYDRWLRNSEAARAKSGPSGEATTTLETAGGVQPMVTGSSITYPSINSNPSLLDATSAMQQQPPPSRSTGQLIDLGSDITATPPAPPQEGGNTADDIMTQLAQMGITTTSPAPPISSTSANMANGVQQQQQQLAQNSQWQRESLSDEFDMFAQSRTAYKTQQQGSSYDDNMIQQDASLSSAVRLRDLSPSQQQAPPSSAATNPYNDLTQWLAQTDLPPPESATSAEFDQFLAQRASKGDSLPATRARPQMQKMEDQSDELFAL